MADEIFEVNSEGKKTEVKQKKPRRGLFLLLGIVIGIVISVAGIGILGAYYGSVGTLSTGSSVERAVSDESMAKLQRLETLINRYYYQPEDIDQEKLRNGMYDGLMSAMGDPYTTYYDEEELKELQEDESGTYAGVGAYLTLDPDTAMTMISGIIPNTPAEEAGLMAGDIIYKVDGKETTGMDLSLVAGSVRGPVGTQVTLTIYRKGESDYREITLTRRDVVTIMVESEMKEDGIGYISLAQFDGKAASQFKENLSDLKAQGMKGMILDLRGNPGGDVDIAVSIAKQLIPEGLIFYYEDKNGNRTEYETDGEDALGLPIIVLVNGGSASASEILSGAIQDSGAGILLGTQTYGKGIVQSVMDLNDGTAVKITIAKYYTRNGHDIHGIGITPDVELEFDSESYQADETDNQLDKAIELMREQLKEN